MSNICSFALWIHFIHFVKPADCVCAPLTLWPFTFTVSQIITSLCSLLVPLSTNQLITHSSSDPVTLAWWSGCYIWQSHKRRIKEMEKYARAKRYGKAWHMFTCPRAALWTPLLQQQVESFSPSLLQIHILMQEQSFVFSTACEWESLPIKERLNFYEHSEDSSMIHGDATEDFWSKIVGRGCGEKEKWS